MQRLQSTILLASGSPRLADAPTLTALTEKAQNDGRYVYVCVKSCRRYPTFILVIDLCGPLSTFKVAFKVIRKFVIDFLSA